MGTTDTEDPKLDALLRQLARDSGESRVDGGRLSSGTRLLGGRFTIIRTLGEGGMGVVYEALDAETRARVALKTLPQAEPTKLYRFKNEFRLLAEIRHDNLVHLYELFADGEVWFFTMELIDGEPFSKWVRPGGLLDEARLRRATHELCAGLATAHRHGRLHRDLKPSNVLVSKAGRVAILDFGLASEPDVGGIGQTVPTQAILGTPDYMAPEQAAGLPTSAASDCYSLGVTLFEALTGRLPFLGLTGEVLAAKQRDAPPKVSAVCPTAPPDLATLCDELLAQTPEARPPLSAIMARLGPQLVPNSVSPDRKTPQLIGRDRELLALQSAYEETLAGKPVVVSLHGESGIGKSSLCDAFTSALRQEGSPVVLAGQCRERENVPFKALDAVIDELSRYLRRLPTEQAAALLPRDAFALRTVFPVLARVEAVAAMPGRGRCSDQELRRLAFSALAELLARLRDQRPLVICIDDLQWADVDSISLLRHLLVDREPPPCLLLLVHRKEESFNEMVLDAAVANTQLHIHELDLRPLAPGDAERLAAAMLGTDGPLARELGPTIARESAGVPFWTAELARFALAVSDKAVQEAASVSSAVLARVRLLPQPAQSALELLALVGRPMPLDLLLEASGSSSNDIDMLRAAQLVRGRRDDGVMLLECSHDRILDIVANSLPEERRTRHYGQLASLLIANEAANPRLISTCLEKVGDRSGAARYAILAAEQAAVALAFERAASLYTVALTLGEFEPEERGHLLVKLGTALEHAGLGRDAAAAYRRAAAAKDANSGIELRRRAAEQLLATGNLADGLSLLDEVCSQVGCRAAPSNQNVLLTYAWNRWRTQFAKVDGSPRIERASPRDRLRLDTAKTLVTGLIGYLPIQAATNASQYLLMALECGDRSDWIRALGFHGHLQSMITPTSPSGGRLLQRMEELADQSDSPMDVGFVNLMRGTVAYHSGRYRSARQHMASALAALRSCSGVDWEVDCANIYDLLSASDSGEYADIARSTPLLVEEAQRRGRVWTAAMLCGCGVPAWLTIDNSAGYRIVLAEAKKHWPAGDTPRWPDFVLLIGESQQLIYSGRPVEAFALFESQLAWYEKSGITRTRGRGISGFAAHHAKAAAAALRSSAVSPRDAQRMQAVVRTSIRSLHNEGAKRQGIALILEAALLCAAGSTREAHSVLVAAAEAFEMAGVSMLAAAARRRAGQLLGGPRGEAMLATAETFMRSQGVRNMDAMTELSCPGCCP